MKSLNPRALDFTWAENRYQFCQMVFWIRLRLMTPLNLTTTRTCCPTILGLAFKLRPERNGTKQDVIREVKSRKCSKFETTPMDF